MTEICGTAVATLGEKQAESWKTLVKQCGQAGRAANVENVLSNVRMKIDAIGDEGVLLGLDREQLRTIERTI